MSGCLLNVTSGKTNYTTRTNLLSVMLRVINTENCVVSSRALQERVHSLDKQDMNPDKFCINEREQAEYANGSLTHNYFRKKLDASYDYSLFQAC